MRQLPLPLSPQAQPRLETFLAGPNAQALDHLKGCIPPGSPVYLWGPEGSGKTHLLRALVAACMQAGEVVAALGPAVRGPWDLAPDVALVVIDDVDRLALPQQASAFAALVQAQDLGIAWACAGRVPPVDLPLREDLRSRIGWGHVFALQPLSDEQTRELLRLEAGRRGIRLREEVTDYLLRRFQRDPGSLVRLIDRLDEYALSQSRDFSPALIRQMLQDEGEALGPKASQGQTACG